MALNVGFIYQIIMNQFWNWDFLETAILFGIWSDIITINQKGV